MSASSELSGNQRRKMKSASRLFAVQALFQMEASDHDLDHVRAEFLDHRFGAEIEDGVVLHEGDVDLFTTLLDGALEQQRLIDQLTDRVLAQTWPIDRIDPTLRAVFRAAGAELLQTDTPHKVVITEYLDITASFFPEGQEIKFANAILDAMAKDLRQT